MTAASARRERIDRNEDAGTASFNANTVAHVAAAVAIQLQQQWAAGGTDAQAAEFEDGSL